MIRGAIVAESLRLGAVVEDVPLVIRKLERVEAGLEEQPRQWTLVWFEADDDDAGRLAEALADALDARGGWYADFHSDTEVTVVFSGRIFRYRQGDNSERARVKQYRAWSACQRSSLIGLSSGPAWAGVPGDALPRPLIRRSEDFGGTSRTRLCEGYVGSMPAFALWPRTTSPSTGFFGWLVDEHLPASPTVVRGRGDVPRQHRALSSGTTRGVAEADVAPRHSRCAGVWSHAGNDLPDSS